MYNTEFLFTYQLHDDEEDQEGVAHGQYSFRHRSNQSVELFEGFEELHSTPKAQEAQELGVGKFSPACGHDDVAYRNDDDGRVEPVGPLGVKRLKTVVAVCKDVEQQL